MPSDQTVWMVEELLAQVPGAQGVLVVTASVADRVTGALPYRPLRLDEVPVGVPWLVVAGGGRLIDEVKRWRVERSPVTQIAAIATIWGSGAEASPIAVTHGAAKHIAIDPALRPDVRVRWAELADHLSPDLARWACGDTLTHATEGLLSPLGDDALRLELAAVVQRMVGGVSDPADWFDLSAAACALQARASVGLVHGIAHVLEPALWADGRRELARHARLCAAWLAPVLRFNLRASPKAQERLERYGIAPAHLLGTAARYGNPQDVIDTTDVVRQLWPTIIRDRCTRTNVALVRPGDVDQLLRELS